MSRLEVSHLSKNFEEIVAVDDVSFHVDGGEIFGLLGPNGAGKSTTMMMISGLLTPDAGTVTIDGKEFKSGNRALRAMLGVVPQDLAIYPDLSGRENLNFFGRLYGLRRDTLRRRVDAALERIGLTGRASDLTVKYSGGMKRRLNFAVALLHEPRIMILDEPTVGVDPQSRSHLLDCVRELKGEGIATIYASHYMEEVQAICDRVAIMDRGNIVASDTLRALLNRMTTDLILRVAPPSQGLVEDLAQLAEVGVETEADAMTITVTEYGAAESMSAVAAHLQRGQALKTGAERTGGGEPAGASALQAMSSKGQALSATLQRILELLEEREVRLLGIETREPNLERLFLELTGSRLRD